MDESLDRLESLFVGVLQAPPAGRAAYLDQACADDPGLRQRVEALLRAQEAAGSFLEPPAPPPVATMEEAPASERPGTVIGPYKLIEQIGEGGMGTVWMAQQTEPVKRVVALKLIKAGMDSKQIIARFEAERQALALMDHANIARVLEGGATENGRPYFVMDLVKGVPITRYCDEHHLTPRQRLELFIPVCQAVQHAHQKGIIHRDLKPSNVLVALYDGKPVPKVIDFGVAKAAGQSLTDKTLVTGFGNIVGTLEYMSPEQAEVNQLDIDTRSDIYSLGVLLYELLTGSTPFTKKDLEKAGMLEMLRVIREQEPSKPSTKLSTAEGLPTLAANRGTEPAKLTKLIRGELDWIVMKALEKDRNRRYETANGFAMDVQRYLADEPVQACPPSVGYRLRKFARRNKAALIMASVIGVALLLAVGSFGWALRDRAAREANLAAKVDLILAEVEQLEKEQRWPEALAAAQRAEALTAGGADAATEKRVRQVLHDLQTVTGLEELRLRETRGPEAGATTDEGHPRLYAAAFRDFGIDVETLPAEESAARLGARPAVAIALAAALDDWARTGRRKDPEKSKRLWALAGAVDPDPWRVSVRQAYAAMDVESLVKLADAPDTAGQPPQSQLLLAASLRLFGQHEKVLALLERACEMHPGDFSIHFQLGCCNYNVHPKRLEAAVRHFVAARALRPRSAATWHNLGVALRDQRKLDEAIAAYRKAIEIDPKYASAHSHLGGALREQKKLDEAVAACRKAIELDPEYAGAYQSLGAALYDQKKLDEAIAVYRKAIELDPTNARMHSNLGAALRDQRKLGDAIAACRKAIELDPNESAAHNNLGLVLRDQKKLDEAIAAYRKAIEIDPQCANAYYTLGHALRDQQKPDEAIAAYKKVIELQPTNANAYSSLGFTLYWGQKKLDEAIACWRKAIELNPKNANVVFYLGVALREQKKLDEAIAVYRQAVRVSPDNPAVHSLLVATLQQAGKPEEAVVALREWVRAQPTNFSAHNKLGNALRAQGKPDEANAAFDKAIELVRNRIELNPNSAGNYWALAGVLRDRGNLDEAIAAYRKAVELDPKQFNAYIDLGNALKDQQKLDEAIAAYRKAVELSPKHTTAYLHLGIALSNQKKWDEAIAAFRQAIELDPKFAGAHYNLGGALATQGKLDDAIACYRRAIELDPKSAGAHNNLGALLCDELGEYDQAIESFGKAIELDPHSTAAQSNLRIAQGMKGWSLVSSPDPKRRDPERAIEAVKRVVELAPQSAGAWQCLGWVQYRLGDWRASVEALEKSCRLGNGGDCAQWIVLALAHAKLAAQEGLPDKVREHHRIEARRRYEQAAKQIDSRWRVRPRGGALQAIWDFRAEARELMAAKDGKK